MPLLGSGALAMWWDMAPNMRSEFEDWHAHEHFPERLSVPGFLRASRWAAHEGPGFFIFYELQSHGVLASPGYLGRLNAPTPWSTKLMPFHTNMVRTQCHVEGSSGGATAHAALTLRLAGVDDPAALRALLPGLAITPGLVGAHLLRHEAPTIAQTREQQIRGGADRAGDWVLVVMGYDAVALAAARGEALSDTALQALGVGAVEAAGTYRLQQCAVAGELQP
jgi:hypothetical protein